MPNDKIAPTSGNTLSADDQVSNAKLSLDQLDFVTFISQYYHLHGELLSEALAEREYGFKPEKYREYMATDKVRAALNQFDVPLDRINKLAALTPDDWRTKAITPQQLMVVNSMLNFMDQRSDNKKLQDLNVKPSQYQTWLKDPVFRDYVNERIEAMVGADGIHRAMRALVDKADQGDVKAIQLLLEYTGKFVPQSNRPAEPVALINFQSIVAKMLEVIIDECDGEVALRIADKFELIMAANNAAADLLESQERVVRVPEVTKAKQLSPEMQALKARAGGNT